MTSQKKCEPLKCQRFTKSFETLDKYASVRSVPPADLFVIKCPFRVKEGNYCINQKEHLDKLLIK